MFPPQGLVSQGYWNKISSACYTNCCFDPATIQTAIKYEKLDLSYLITINISLFDKFFLFSFQKRKKIYIFQYQPTSSGQDWFCPLTFFLQMGMNLCPPFMSSLWTSSYLKRNIYQWLSEWWVGREVSKKRERRATRNVLWNLRQSSPLS